MSFPLLKKIEQNTISHKMLHIFALIKKIETKLICHKMLHVLPFVQENCVKNDSFLPCDRLIIHSTYSHQNLGNPKDTTNINVHDVQFLLRKIRFRQMQHH
ncbi:hypothetical protein CY35_14G008300 [Sphagnum magellanicum]|nr:hypothetical protein CY35_14G008300 [Sphagnum magellanicum]